MTPDGGRAAFTAAMPLTQADVDAASGTRNSPLYAMHVGVALLTALLCLPVNTRPLAAVAR